MVFPHFKSMFRVKGNSNSAMRVGPGRRDGGDRRDAFGRGPGGPHAPRGLWRRGDDAVPMNDWLVVNGCHEFMAFSQKYWVVIIIP